MIRWLIKWWRRRKHNRYKVPPAKEFYQSRQWQQVRYRALIKSGFGRCQACGRTARRDGVTIHVDHIKPRSKYPKLALDIKNLQVICMDCNLGKGTWDETDWR